MVESLIEESGVQRTFVLDTNVLLYDPRALFVFKEHDVIIPITVIEEVDRFKKDLNETGRNARLVSRYMDQLRAQGSLSDGVRLAEGGLLRVELGRPATLPRGLKGDTGDNLILQTVKSMHDQGERPVVLVTRDTNMRLKADAMGIQAEDYLHAHIEVDEYYSGVTTVEIDPARINEFYDKGSLPRDVVQEELFPNQFVLLGAGERQSAMARYDARRERLKMVGRYKEGVWGIRARNKEQLFALELLLDDSLSLVTIDGHAGTGKTLLAIACGLQRVADDKRYRRLLVSRPIFPMGRDLGFLPGDVNEKLNPWMKPIFDNLEVLLSSPESEGGGRPGAPPSYQPLLDQRLLEVEPLTYIRGRSLPRQFVVIDEAQNLTPHEVKTVITRAGEGTKVVLTGDPNQIDNPYVDATSNGLTYVVERFKRSAIAGHITLRKGERSELAQQAAQLL